MTRLTLWPERNSSGAFLDARGNKFARILWNNSLSKKDRNKNYPIQSWKNGQSQQVDKSWTPKFSMKLDKVEKVGTCWQVVEPKVQSKVEKLKKLEASGKKRSTPSPELCSIQSWRELSSTDLLGSGSGWRKFFALDFQLCPSLYRTFKIGLNFELDFGLRLGLWTRLRKLWLGLWLGLWYLARTLNWVLTFGLGLFKTLPWTLYWIQEQWLEVLHFGDLFDSLEFLLGGVFFHDQDLYVLGARNASPRRP